MFRGRGTVFSRKGSNVQRERNSFKKERKQCSEGEEQFKRKGSNGAAWLSMVRRGSDGAAWLSHGAAWLSYGAAWLSW